MMERFKLRAHLDKMSAKEKNVKKCWPKKLLHQTDTQVFLVQTKMMIMLTFAVVWALHIFFCKFDWQKNHGDNFDFIVKCPVILYSGDLNVAPLNNIQIWIPHFLGSLFGTVIVNKSPCLDLIMQLV